MIPKNYLFPDKAQMISNYCCWLFNFFYICI